MKQQSTIDEQIKMLQGQEEKGSKSRKIYIHIDIFLHVYSARLKDETMNTKDDEDGAIESEV